MNHQSNILPWKVKVMHSAPLHSKYRYRGGGDVCGGGGCHGGQGGLGGGDRWCRQLVQSMMVRCIVLHHRSADCGDHWCVLVSGLLVNILILVIGCIVCINWFRLQSFNSWKKKNNPQILTPWL